MNPIQGISLFVLSGLTWCLAAYFFLLFLYFMHQKKFLYFSLLAFTVGLNSFSTAMIANAYLITVRGLWLGIAMVSFILSTLILYQFVAQVTNRKSRAVLTVLSGLTVFFIAYYLDHFLLPDWLKILLIAEKISVWLIAIHSSWKSFQQEKTKVIILVGLGSIFMLTGVLIDILVSETFITYGIGVSDFTFPLMVFLISLIFFSDIGENSMMKTSLELANQNLREIQESLEYRITERTAMLSDEIERRSKLEKQLRESEERYKSLSTMDPLTHLHNRRHFNTMAANEFERYRRYRVGFSLIYLDIDHFKWVNDRFGHAIGDVVLVGLANLMRMNIRETDQACRIGGEEFVIVMPNTDNTEAVRIAERFLNLIPQLQFAELPDDESITVSMGVATVTREDQTVEEVINRADRALYQAKESGRNRVINQPRLPADESPDRNQA
ncbi:MAG: diguanylate cyclase [Anaerolineaceae bacterium]|nr:diguanylate cyclase [Anaerolineaceae bacterium]